MDECDVYRILEECKKRTHLSVPIDNDGYFDIVTIADLEDILEELKTGD